MADVLADADAARLGVRGHDQPEVVAQHALVGTAVIEDVLARRQNRDHRGRHPRDLAHQRGGSRAHLHAELRLEAVAVEEQRLPAVIVCDLDLIGGDVLEVRQRRLMLEQALDLLTDDVRVLFDVRDPGEALELEERRVTDERASPDEPLDRRQHAFAERDR
jgi:hypothetical protein